VFDLRASTSINLIAHPYFHKSFEYSKINNRSQFYAQSATKKYAIQKYLNILDGPISSTNRHVSHENDTLTVTSDHYSEEQGSNHGWKTVIFEYSVFYLAPYTNLQFVILHQATVDYSLSSTANAVRNTQYLLRGN
jgi:hypothetical protein